MCGICGAIGIESRDEGGSVLARMLHAIVHRGPDEEGALVAPGFAAGTRRLSIIDLAGGSQPIWNETKTLAICFNGEIYNFNAVRQELLAVGHQFRTRSDTEVIVHAYEQWGAAGFERLEGMFAFVITEMPQGPSGRVTKFVLARDRFGIKPLYYAIADGKFLFASEVRALLASGFVRPQLARESVSAYLMFGSVCEPMTLVEGVFSLPPGHFAEVPVTKRIDQIESKPYWSVKSREARSSQAPQNGAPDSQVSDRVRSYLDAAVRSHLIADVPVGVFLSSGLDSTAIAALAARAQSGIHTFTVAFPDLEFSEAAEARRTAERLGTTHSDLRLSGQEMLERLDEAVAAFDQPSMDGVNTYFVSWAARQSGLKVALSGLGSDEIFGGYPTFQSTRSVARMASFARSFPKGLRHAGQGVLHLLRPDTLAKPSFQKASAAWIAPDALPDPYFFTRTLFTPGQVATATKLGAAGNGDVTSGSLWWAWMVQSAREARSLDDFGAVSWLELRSYMLNTLLRDTDAMSMASSLEVRVPFLDPPLVEYLLSLPAALKEAGQRPKSLLISALGDLLPENVRSQVGQKKRTFTFPWEKWLRGPLKDRVSSGLTEWAPALAPVLSRDFALGTWKDFQEGRTTWSRPWSLYVLNEWAKRHLQIVADACSVDTRPPVVVPSRLSVRSLP
jgi:asparagine synthase (glutamine-hydrolysing)